MTDIRYHVAPDPEASGELTLYTNDTPPTVIIREGNFPTRDMFMAFVAGAMLP